jgi:hypothetical protein
MIAATNSKLLSDELELESQKVRSMYEIGQSTDSVTGSLSAPLISTTMVEEEAADESEQFVCPSNDMETIDKFRLNGHEESPKFNNVLRPNSALTTGRASSIKMEHELAGGIEDWEDISGGDVDRYGFITVRKEPANRSSTPEPRPPQRISTVSKAKLHMQV